MSSKPFKPGLLRRLKIMYFKRISNRRRYLRVPLRVKVTHNNTGYFEYFSSTNISVGGMFLRAESPHAAGTLLMLEFTLPEQSQPINLNGEVVRVVHPTDDKTGKFDPGMGVMFTKIERDALDQIKKFVQEQEKNAKQNAGY